MAAYDIAIVGAGPAGSTLGRLLGDGGLKVLLLDGQTRERSKPCGGLLAPDAQKSLAGFDLTLPKSVLVDPQIFSVRTIDLEQQRTRYYTRHYINMDRYAFDRWLLSLTPPSVEVLAGRCRRADRGSQGFRLLVETAEGNRVIEARRLIGADGADSLIRRSFFPDQIRRYVAIQQWFPAREDIDPFYSCVFDPKTSESCSWSIYKNEYFIFGGCFAPQGCRAAFEEQKRRLEERCGFSFGEPLKTEACLALRPCRGRDFITGGQGVYLAGEAAGFISPSSLEGISYAIDSARCLALALLAEADEGRAARAYRRATGGIRRKLLLKTVKRWFMYTPFMRRLIMASGLSSIKPMLRKQP